MGKKCNLLTQILFICDANLSSHVKYSGKPLSQKIIFLRELTRQNVSIVSPQKSIASVGKYLSGQVLSQDKFQLCETH